jgi:two-component system, OmpR family, sensor histidine kinase MprB
VSLRLRIAAIAGVAVALTVIGVAAGVYVAVRSNLHGEVEDALELRARGFAQRQAARPPLPGPGGPPPLRGRFRGGPPPGFGGPPRRLEPGRFGGAEGVAQVISPAGRVRDRDGGRRGLPVDSRARTIAASGQGSETYETEVDGTNLLVLTEGLGRRGAVQVARPLTEVDDSLNRVLFAVVVIGALGVALAVLLGALVARAALAPIARFTRRTEAIAARPDLSERIEVEGDDELARLAHSFNATLDALEGAVESQRRLVADASHELRTPIASLRANFETLRESERLPPSDREALRSDIIEELDELTALVSDVVELARGARPEESLDDVRLDSLVADLIERAQRRGDGAPVFKPDLEPTLVRGAPDRIARAVSNLLDNARAWSPPGGTVEVSLSNGTLSVRDHGPGFSETDLPRVFERFYRADEARGMQGSGLGLAIVKQAAETHRGTVEAANAPGGGALVRVSFGPVLDQTGVPGVLG